MPVAPAPPALVSGIVRFQVSLFSTKASPSPMTWVGTAVPAVEERLRRGARVHQGRMGHDDAGAGVTVDSGGLDVDRRVDQGGADLRRRQAGTADLRSAAMAAACGAAAEVP